MGATPAGVGLEAFSEVSFKSEDGVPLKAWWVPAGDGANGRAAILVHGWYGSRSERQLLATAKIYHRAGYAVLRGMPMAVVNEDAGVVSTGRGPSTSAGRS